MPWDDKVVDHYAKNFSEIAGGRILNYTKAINEALTQAMERFSEVFILGQGVDDPGAMFGTTKNLSEKFGPERVFDTPVSEDSITGFCVGAAMNGLRPVYMHNRPDFLLLTFNQLVSHASKYHFMSNGKFKVPMVVWSAIGRGWGSGAQHTQAIQGLLMGVPGLRIIMPSTPFETKGLILAAIEDNNPVIFIEHRWLMKKDGPVPEEYYTLDLNKAVVKREGADVSVIGSSLILDQTLEVAEELSSEGIDVEVVDLRSLWPWDKETVFSSVRKTRRALIIDTGWEAGGVCSEIGFSVTENCFNELKAPPARLGLPDCPTPSGHILENEFYPNKTKIKKAIKDLLEKGR